MVLDLKNAECIQCNKCTFHCPVHRVDVKFSPRKVILQLFFGDKNFSERDIWACLTCAECVDACPSKVDYPEIIRNLRIGLKGNLQRNYPCKHGTMMESLQRMMANPNLKQERTYWIEDRSQISQNGQVLYFTGCIPYLNGIFEYCDSYEIGRSALKVFKALGIKPIVSNEERCCGHDLLWNGDYEGYERLAKQNKGWIERSGAKRVVATCAECYHTLAYDYPKLLGDWNAEILHMSQFMEEMINSGKLKFRGLEEKVTFHDPCRLGRRSGEYEAPRKVLRSIPNLQLVEMERVKENAVCCGVGGYANCDWFTKFIQHERLEEAQEKANSLVTACPHCRIHYSCYLKGRPIENLKELKIEDLTTLAARALGG